MVDYRKWDNLEDSDDEKEARPVSAHVSRHQMVGGGGCRPKSLFVRLDEHDDGVGLRRIFLTDPRRFTPVRDPGLGVFVRWGLPTEEEGDGEAGVMRPMRTQFMYGSFNELLPPEEQFLAVLVDAKREKMIAALPGLGPHLSTDLVIKVSLRGTNPLVWRRIRVAAGTNLRTFHDRVLGPSMGWERNYHGYWFTDFSDGALWCPLDECSAVDMMHANLHVIAALKPQETKIGELLRAAGDSCGYTYDLGDLFDHVRSRPAILISTMSHPGHQHHH